MFPAHELRWLAGIQGFVIDVDGVLRIGNRPIDGAGRALAELRRRDVPFCLLTNVTRRSRAEEAARLCAMGIEIAPEEIFTASALAAAYVRRLRPPAIWLLLDGSAREEFAGIPQDEETAALVVVGDVEDSAPIALFHRAYRALLRGATLIAIQRNRAWTGDDGMARLDVGAWVAALEYASGRPAVVMGKPSPQAYTTTAQAMGISPAHLAMVSDDPAVDLAGARQAGLVTIRVRTTSLPQQASRPAEEHAADLTLDSIADLPALWDALSARTPASSQSRTRRPL